MPAVDTARAILSTLEDLGLTHVLYCPGSRSAPFAYALEAGVFGGDARPLLDERSAGFAAVGLARTGALPAIIVTSGTAVAELTPAVLEASHARLPLLVLSADRPGELRGVGASQATAQAGLFGVHARASIDLEPQEPSRSLVGQLSRALAAALGAPTGTPGPVQINVAFRDPLTPQGGRVGAGFDGGSAPDPADEAPASFVPRPTRVLPASLAPVRWEDVVGEACAGLIVAGEGASPRAAQWSLTAGFPLLAEPASGAWAGGGVTPFEQAIVSSPLGREVDTVVVTGRPTLSRPIHALLARPDVRVIVVDAGTPWVDVSGNASVVVPALAAPRVPSCESSWAARVRFAADEAASRIDALLAGGSGRSMLDLARAVAAATGGPLVHGIAAKAVAMKVAGTQEFKDRQARTIEGAAILAERLRADDARAAGIRLVTGGTDVHLVLVDLRDSSLDGQQAEDLLHAAGITVNRNAVPFDPRPARVTSGLRIGTPALATRGFGAPEFTEVADIIATALVAGAAGRADDELLARLKGRVSALTDAFPLYPGLVQ